MTPLPTTPVRGHAGLGRWLCGLVALALHCATQGAPAPLPKDVADFIERRDACDHWRDTQSSDEEKRKDIAWSVCQSCPGTDADLAKLKRKYEANKAVMDKLSAYEPVVEPKDKAAASKACAATRKPPWLH